MDYPITLSEAQADAHTISEVNDEAKTLSQLNKSGGDN